MPEGQPEGAATGANGNGAKPLPRWLPPFGVQLASAAASALLFILWVRNGWGGEQATVAFVDIASAVVPLAASWACFLRARQTTQDVRTAWSLLGLALVAWALGQAAWTAVELSTGAPPDTPSLADVGYLAFIPLAAWGVVRFGKRGDGRSEGVAPLLDGAIIASSFIFLCFVIGLEDTLVSSDQSDLALIVNLLYPFGDGLILGIVLLRLSRTPRAARTALLLLASGFVMLSIADLWFLVVNAAGTYDTGGLLDAFWVMGFQLIGLAAVRPINLESGVAPPQQTPSLAFVPLYPFFVGTAAAMYAVLRDGLLTDTLFWTALTVILLMTARLMTMLLENMRLARTEKRAVAELRDEKALRTQLLNNLTHDLLSPMSPVLIQVKLLRDGTPGPLNDRQARALDIVRRNLEQVQRLAVDLKDLANLEGRSLKVLPGSCDLVELAHQSVATYQEEATLRGIALAYDGPPSAPCTGDAGRLAQVLDNLLSNACKFTPSGGRITLRISREPAELALEVTDSGRGLTADEAARLFRPFSQVHERTEIKERGTGLGLYISRGIAESHGGRLDVSSQGRGHGTTFRLSLPAQP
ncbi:MAG: HAMP domain-containing sensor histidine kinase [Candidatus Thermoplasmatota archaeon]